MKTEIATLIVDAATYQIIIKFIVTSITKKLVTQSKIIVFDETSIIQIQLANVAKIYFQL